MLPKYVITDVVHAEFNLKKTACLACRELAEESNDDTRLQFRGFLTDGGMQDDDTSFWVDNMFHHDISAFYTSR